MNSKILNTVSAVILVSSIGFLVFVFSSLFIPPHIVVPKVQPYKILTPVVKSGSQVIYVASLCKYAEVVAVVSRSLTGETSYQLPDSISHIQTGCGASNVAVPIPDNVSPGIYQLHLDILYQVNFLRQESYHFVTDKFTIIQ